MYGLTDVEVQTRRAEGLGNPAPPPTTRRLVDILRANVFTTINILIFLIALALGLLGNIGDAITSGGLVFINAAVGIIQELRAKRKLDQIALLNRPHATALRRQDGQDAEVLLDPSALVKDDVLVLTPGEQVVLDGQIIEGQAECDESLLTGESDLIVKTSGDKVLSGSFCVTGRALYRAEKVGADSYASQLAGKARRFRTIKTPLQREIDFVLRLLMLIALVIGFMMLVSSVVNRLPPLRSLQAAAVIAGIVPNGLVLAILVAYSLGAVRIAQKGALVQQTNAIESLSNVDVLCMDKTGTLTANRITLHSIVPVASSEADIKRIAGDFAASARVSNKTSDAIAKALSGRKLPVQDEVPFSSSLKWSALCFGDQRDHSDPVEPGAQGVTVLGAPEVLRDHIQPDHDYEGPIAQLAEKGLRVLLLARQPNTCTLHDAQGRPQLPDNMCPLGLIVFGDELRPEARATIQSFQGAGIQLKVISGDSPATVVALAKQAGFSHDIKSISGPELDLLPPALFAQAAEETTVFGRVTPEQKERLVDVLRETGHYVAMIGDGVNDVLSLKKANLGIAMQSGTSATRGVADMILLNDSFAALVPAFSEGQRIVNGMRSILSLFLTRCLYVALIIVATGFVGVGFPFGPRNITLLTALTVGLPTIMLAYWAKPAVVRGGLLHSIWPFIVPATLTMLVFGLTAYVFAFGVVNRDLLSRIISPAAVRAFEETVATLQGPIRPGTEQYVFLRATTLAQTIVTLFSLLAGLMLVLFVQPPFPLLAGGRPLVGDKRVAWLAITEFLIFVVGWNIRLLRRFFVIALLPNMFVLGFIVLLTLAWAVVLMFVWRHRFYERWVLGHNNPMVDTAVDLDKRG